VQAEQGLMVNDSEIFDGLNEDQRRAVLLAEGPVLIVAGPGTGKTLTLVRRIANLIQNGARPEEILTVTFTNRAAREMRERVTRFLGPAGSGLFVGTFHLLGLRIMRDSIKGEVTVYNREKQVDLLKDLTGSRRKAEQALEGVSRVKNLMDEGSEETRRLCGAYEEALRSEGAYDFDDLILIPVELLQDSVTRAKYSSGFRYIMVDEYQDISPSQYRLLRCLVGADSNICAVGDSDQAIYAFRGADVENFLNFQRDFPGASVVSLGKNYRSTGNLVRVSNTLIAWNDKRIEKTLEATREEGLPITVVSVPDERGEGEAIVAEIEARIGATSHYRLASRDMGGNSSDGSYSFADFAVVFRTHSHAKALGAALEESGIPYQVIGGRKPTKSDEIATRLRACVNGFQEGDSLADLLGKAATELCVSDDDGLLLDQLAAAYGDLPLEEALVMAADELSLATSGDGFDPRAEAVTLMTLHGAKGLEFRVVFITGVEDGMIPFGKLRGEENIEEERRLFYVGMTRARDELFLIHGRSRMVHGQRLSQQPSPFINEIPTEFMRTKSRSERPNKQKRRQMELF
jgi:DNA helicase-2/ATP-dependent DNA helicase PcrA